MGAYRPAVPLPWPTSISSKTRTSWKTLHRWANTLQINFKPLHAHPMVGDIRGVGLMWGVELVKDRKTKEKLTRREGVDLVLKLRNAGLITRAEDATIRIVPPLVITKDEIDESIAIIDKVIGQLEEELL